MLPSRVIPGLFLLASLVLLATIRWGNEDRQKPTETSPKSQEKSAFQEKQNEDYITPSINDSVKEVECDNFKKLGTPDYLPTQVFTIKNTSSVNTFVTENGLKVTIPPNAFKTHKVVQIKVKEAFSKAQIAQAGLNTRCGDRVLESEGMFQITAFAGGRAISLDPKVGMKIDFPRASYDTTYKLFTAQPDRFGNITDWNLSKIDAKRKPECSDGDMECFRCKTILKDYFKASKDTVPNYYFIINRDDVSLIYIRPVEEQLFNIAISNRNLSLEEQKHQYEMNTMMFESAYEKRAEKFKFLYAVYKSRDLAPNIKKSQLLNVLRSYIDKELSLPVDHPIPYKGRSMGTKIISLINDNLLISKKRNLFYHRISLKDIQNVKIAGNGDSLIVRFAGKRGRSKYQWGLNKRLWMYSHNSRSMIVYVDSARFCECKKAYPNYYRRLQSFTDQITDLANVFEVYSLGWFNIDRFYNQDQELLTFKGKIVPENYHHKISFKNGNECKVHIISERNNIHLLGNYQNDGSFSFNFFKGEPVKIIVRNEDYVSVWEGTLDEATLPIMKLKKVSREEVTQLFAGL